MGGGGGEGGRGKLDRTVKNQNEYSILVSELNTETKEIFKKIPKVRTKVLGIAHN
jgi:hypothetical protein